MFLRFSKSAKIFLTLYFRGNERKLLPLAFLILLSLEKANLNLSSTFDFIDKYNQSTGVGIEVAKVACFREKLELLFL